MLGAGLQFGRSRGDDRFHYPARARRNVQNKQNQDHPRRAQSDCPTKDKPVLVFPAKIEPENRAGSEEPLKPVVSPLCNLERFLESITPSVPAQYLSKTTMREWKTCDEEFQPYFLLSDLWESFKEWSVYGAGVPLILNESDSVVQYYVPYLSGIQLYGDSSKFSVKSRLSSDDSEGDYFRDSSSDGSSDCDNERAFLNHSRELKYQHLPNENLVRMDRLTLRDQNNVLQEGFPSDEGECGNSQGCLLFEYLERDPPYSRIPLADKIYQLAFHFPELQKLRSCDLLSSSWISVAWYPIYRIPTGTTLKDLDACFLTFHSLHTPIAGPQGGEAPSVTYPGGVDGVPEITLPVFGIASYKFKASPWSPNGGRGCQLVNSLSQAADNWLKLLQVNHPDFLFFSRR